MEDGLNYPGEWPLAHEEWRQIKAAKDARDRTWAHTKVARTGRKEA